MHSSVDASHSPPRVTIPRDYNAAVDFIDRHVTEGRGGKVAFIDDRGPLTYAELCERVGRAGNALASLGCAIEQRVALCLLDSVDFPTVFFGAIKIGAVPVPLNTLLTTQDYAFMLRDSRAGIAVVSDELMPKLEPAAKASPFLRHLISGQQAARPARRRVARPSGGADVQRRRRFLALLLGLHRHAQGRGAPALAPGADRGALRRGRARHARRTTSSSPRPSSSSPTAWATR